MRRILAAALVAVMAMGFSGCGKSGGGGPADTSAGDTGVDAPGDALQSDEAADALSGANPQLIADEEVTDGGTLVWRMPAEPATLNPLTYRDLYGAIVVGLTTDGLVERNPDTLEWEPGIAESWESSDDHLTYTFHLRKDVRWHDGEPFTADDIVYSAKVLKDPATPAPRIQNYYNDLESVTSSDDYTVTFKWKEPYFKSFENSAGLPIFPKHVFDTGEDFAEHPAGRWPVGNGLYKFAQWKANEHIILERNEEYFGRKPHIKRLVLKFVTDDNTALLLASSGEMDYVSRMQAEAWIRETVKPVFREQFNRYYYYMPSYGYRYIGWNMSRPFFADKRVRQAMTHLVRREEILKRVMHGLGQIVTGPFYTEAPAYDKSIEPYVFDTQEAKRLLDEAGWVDHNDDGLRDKMVDGERVDFSFTFMYPSGRKISEVIAVLLQEDLAKIGIEMQIRQLEWATFEEQLTNGNFDAVTLGWTGSLEGDPYQIWHSSQKDGGSNYIGFANAEADGIIEKGRREFDADKRNAMYRRLHAILHDQQPYTFLFTSPELMILDKRFHNVAIHKLGVDMRDWHVPSALQKAN